MGLGISMSSRKTSLFLRFGGWVSSNSSSGNVVGNLERLTQFETHLRRTGYRRRSNVWGMVSSVEALLDLSRKSFSNLNAASKSAIVNVIREWLVHTCSVQHPHFFCAAICSHRCMLCQHPFVLHRVPASRPTDCIVTNKPRITHYGDGVVRSEKNNCEHAIRRKCATVALLRFRRKH